MQIAIPSQWTVSRETMRVLKLASSTIYDPITRLLGESNLWSLFLWHQILIGFR